MVSKTRDDLNLVDRSLYMKYLWAIILNEFYIFLSLSTIFWVIWGRDSILEKGV